MSIRTWLQGLCVLCLTGCAGHPPLHLGVQNGRLTPCPNSPNCVSSQCQDAQHFIPPFHYTGARSDAKQHLKKVISAWPRTRVIQEREDYWHVEFTSALWRFVDDVEFYWEPSEPIIHIRSASRLGYGDLGVNRKRMEALREQCGWK